ncbi:MAG: phospholipase D-like domain-containing protein [Verrucomicrobiota bacterium]
MAAAEFQVAGGNRQALFTLKVHRGDGMALLAMNWKDGRPPDDFVGFGIEYREPGGDRFYPLKNRLAFPTPGGGLNPNQLSTLQSPIQKFRWVHFPRNADLDGDFTYQVTPVFMGGDDALSYGDPQTVAIELRRDTYPGILNVAFTRGFVSSQAFVDFYESAGPISTLLPPNADAGLDFVPTHPKADKALAWMGFEARRAILDVLDAAVADTQAKVSVIAYDLNEPEVVGRLKGLGGRLRIIVDDSDAHGEPGSAETRAAGELALSAGGENVRRQHVLNLQHNKVIVVDGPRGRTVVCGSTNFSWRGFYVQNNNALVLQGATAVAAYQAAFDAYWTGPAKDFGGTASAKWAKLGLQGIDARVAFSPHSASNAMLAKIADDIGRHTTSSLLFSLAFLYQTPGPVLTAIQDVTARDGVFVYGISDRRVGGFDFLKPDGNVAPVYPSQLRKGIPPPFSAEPTGGGGIRMHHKFVVIDFDKPTARVYLGSYNFSNPADTKNGENLLRIRNRRIAVSFMIEALRICDHYDFRVSQSSYEKAGTPFVLRKPPRGPGDVAWWQKDYTDARRIRDRELFA